MLYDFNHGLVVDSKWVGINMRETGNLLVISHTTTVG